MKRIRLSGIIALLAVAVLCTGCKQYTETEESTLIPDLIDKQETSVPAPDPPKRSEPEEETGEQSENCRRRLRIKTARRRLMQSARNTKTALTARCLPR